MAVATAWDNPDIFILPSKEEWDLSAFEKWATQNTFVRIDAPQFKKHSTRGHVYEYAPLDDAQLSNGVAGIYWWENRQDKDNPVLCITGRRFIWDREECIFFPYHPNDQVAFAYGFGCCANWGSV